MASPLDLPPDPRLETPSTFSHDAIVAAVTAFYTHLPHIRPSQVVHAPPGGWPSITLQTLAQWNLHPTPAAARLLAHLPYITAPSLARVAPHHAHIDHRHVAWPPAAFTSPPPPDADADAGPDRPPRDLFPPPWLQSQLLASAAVPVSVVALTGADGDGRGYECLLVDTLDGTATRFRPEPWSFRAPRGHYHANDPRAWREDPRCHEITMPAVEMLAQWGRKFVTMEWIGVPISDSNAVFEANVWPDWATPQFGLSQLHRWETEVLVGIYKRHGWPDNYRDGDACRREVLAWWEDNEEERRARSMA